MKNWKAFVSVGDIVSIEAKQPNKIVIVLRDNPPVSVDYCNESKMLEAMRAIDTQLITSRRFVSVLSGLEFKAETILCGDAQR